MADYREYTVEQDESGIRIDRFIADRESELSRSFIQKLISDGHVTVDGSQTKSSYKVGAGDTVKLILPRRESETVPRAEDIPLDIVFEDNELIVVNKPAGMVVHPAAGVDSGTLVNALLAHVSTELPGHTANKQGVQEEYEEDAEEFDLISISPKRPGIVHRIDKGTSGIIVVAKTITAYYSLAEQIREHSVRRKYIALVCGDPKQDSGIIVAPIGRNRRDRKKMAVTPVNSKEAITQFSVKERYGNFSMVELTLKTGRTHQIRVHMAHIGHPVVGDPTYGNRKRALRIVTSPKVKTAIQRLSRQALHARLLGFIHPATGEYMEFSAPIPDDIQDVIDALRSEAFSEEEDAGGSGKQAVRYRRSA